jgi:hypothetical protein
MKKLALVCWAIIFTSSVYGQGPKLTADLAIGLHNDSKVIGAGGLLNLAYTRTKSPESIVSHGPRLGIGYFVQAADDVRDARYLVVQPGYQLSVHIVKARRLGVSFNPYASLVFTAGRKEAGGEFRLPEENFRNFYPTAGLDLSMEFGSPEGWAFRLVPLGFQLGSSEALMIYAAAGLRLNL